VHDQLNVFYASTSLILRLPTFTPRDLAPNLEEVSHWNTLINASAPALERNHGLKQPLLATDRLAVGSSMMMPGTNARSARRPAAIEPLGLAGARVSNPVSRLNQTRLSGASRASEKPSSGSAILLRRAVDGNRPPVEDVPSKREDEHFAVDLSILFALTLPPACPPQATRRYAGAAGSVIGQQFYAAGKSTVQSPTHAHR